MLIIVIKLKNDLIDKNLIIKCLSGTSHIKKISNIFGLVINDDKN